MQKISYRKVEFATEKENYPWQMHAGGSNFSAAAKQYPQEAAAVREVATCVDGMNLHWHNVFMKNHQERK